MKAADAELRRILVVDDNLDQADSLADLLHQSGYQTRTANNGELPLAVFAEFQPQCVMLDVHMPRMSGQELAETLRTYFVDDVLLIGMSGYPAGDRSVASAIALVDHYFRKPIDIQALAKVLPRVAAGASARPID